MFYLSAVAVVLIPVPLIHVPYRPMKLPLLILALLLDLGWREIPDLWLGLMVWAVTLSTVASGLQYVLLWGYRAVVESRQQREEQ